VRTELKTAAVRIPEEIRSRLADEVDRFSQMLALRVGVQHYLSRN
jgi:hypothetical protein